MITWQELFGKVCDTLAILTYSTRLRSAGGDLGTNYAAENFYCGLLNIILEREYPGICLENMNARKNNYPGVDLGDERMGIAVQVTTTQNRGKINHTLDEFFKCNLDKVFPERLIVLVIGKKDDFKKEFTVLRGYKFNQAEDIWDTDHLGKEIAKLDLDGLKKLNAYLQETLNLIPAQERGLRLPVSAMNEDFFVGREQELAELAKRVEKKNSGPIFVTGLGGMGKTELVARFCADYEGGRAHLVRFRENFTQTVAVGVASGIEGYSDREPDEDRDYAEAMERLRSYGPGDILVIDNADEPDGNFGKLQMDPAWRELRQLPLRLIITTRCEVPGAIRVGHMDNETLYRIFENQELSMDESQIDALIDAVDGHTMTVELIARTLKRSRTLSAETLLDALKKGDLASQRLRPVVMERNGEVEQERIYGHLRNLFNVVEISKEARNILRDMVLLPENGLSMDIFEAIMNDESLELLESQIDHGWLSYDEGSKFVTIHPVIRLVCRKELNPDDEKCREFLNGLWNQYDEKQYDAGKFRQFAELFSIAAEILPDRQGVCSFRAGYFWNQIGQTEKALAYELLTVQRGEENDLGAKELAIVHNNLGLTYGELGEHKKALHHQLRALELREMALPPDHPDLAISYNDLGNTYGALGDHCKALEYIMKALKLREKVLPAADLSLAISYNNAGAAYFDLGEYSRALEYQLKALAIYEKVLTQEHPDLATAYDNVGVTLGALGDSEKALEYQVKALTIREKILPADHPALAASYNNLGVTYSALGGHEKALEYTLKAIAIREKILPPDHPELMLSYDHVANFCGALGVHEKALEYILKKLEICERILPQNHPDLAISYGNVGLAYGALGDHNRELEYKLRALEIDKKILGDHPDLATSYSHVAHSYAAQGAFDTALEYAKKALAIRENALPEGHPYTENTRKTVQMLEVLNMLKEEGIDVPNPFNLQ